MEKHDFVQKLQRIALFRAMDSDFFEKFIPVLETEHVRRGHALIKEGDVGRGMFFLLSGTVRISKRTLSGEDYTVALLKDEQGIFFGEVGLLSEDTRTATVIAETDCQVAKLSAEHFNRFIGDSPKYGVAILKELVVAISKKLKKSNQDTVVLYEALIGEIGHSFL